MSMHFDIIIGFVLEICGKFELNYKNSSIGIATDWIVPTWQEIITFSRTKWYADLSRLNWYIDKSEHDNRTLEIIGDAQWGLIKLAEIRKICKICWHYCWSDTKIIIPRSNEWRIMDFESLGESRSTISVIPVRTLLKNWQSSPKNCFISIFESWTQYQRVLSPLVQITNLMLPINFKNDKLNEIKMLLSTLAFRVHKLQQSA